MRGLVYLVVTLAVSSALSGNGEPDEIKDVITTSKTTQEINEAAGLTDDIVEAPKLMPARQRSALNYPSYLWTSPVAYVLDNSLEMNARGVIMKAITQFKLKSCIDFKPRDAEDYYLSFVKLDGCFSYVGKWIKNGQNISIGAYCDDISIVEHEILHALGFFHEQSRYDRDSYVTIRFENILEGRERNFEKVSKNDSTDNGVPYDYLSVMHYGKNAFSNGNGSTIVTKDPKFEDVIGQRYEISHMDNLELNLLYECNSPVIKNLFCDFSNGTTCQMSHCGNGNIDWKLVASVPNGPNTDHTSLPSGNNTPSPGRVGAHFMHASTKAAGLGDSARLETSRMMPSGMCNVQCLQFYYFHSGNHADQLNIWLREFRSESDQTGTNRLVKQITGMRTSHWQIVHVPLNATKLYQVVFVVRKGNGTSEGGFSIDDINLSGTECPHFTMQLNNFERLLNESDFGHSISGPRLHSSGGYSYRFGMLLYKTYFGMYVQLLSGENDDNLEWPVPRRQVTFHMMDQQPDLRDRMSKEKSFTSDLVTFGNGSLLWDDPRTVGTQYQDDDGQTRYEGPKIGTTYYSDLEEIKYFSFLKGESAVFTFRFEDLTPLVSGNALPCPEVEQEPVANPPPDGPGDMCFQISPTDDSIFATAPGLMAAPVFVFLLALICFIP